MLFWIVYHSLRFEEILTSQRNEQDISSISYGCLMGTGLAVITSLCFYLAVFWGNRYLPLSFCPSALLHYRVCGVGYP